MRENEIAKTVVDICFRIHFEYGPGLLESVYQKLICYELEELELPFESQVSIALLHDALRIDSAFRADIVVDDSVIIEIKSVEKLSEVHFKQLLTYLRLTDLKLGLLVNFNVPAIRDGIRRVVNNL